MSSRIPLVSYQPIRSVSLFSDIISASGRSVGNVLADLCRVVFEYDMIFFSFRHKASP